MPGPTLRACADHGQASGDTITGGYGDASRVFRQRAAAGIDFDDVTGELERDGLAKFEKSWSELSNTVADGLQRQGRPASS
jgi:transaldolase